MMPITISGVGVVDANSVIESLVAKVAELTLENAGLRALCATYQGLALAHVADPADRPSESPVGVSPEATNGHREHSLAP